MRIRVVGTVVAAVLALAGCGVVADVLDGDGVEPVSGSSLQLAATLIVDEHGPVEGFSLIMLAIDQGYTPLQITRNALEIEFRGYEERVLDEAPAGTPQGTLSPPEEVSALGAAPAGFGMARVVPAEDEPTGPSAAQMQASPGAQALGVIWATTDWVTEIPGAAPAADADWEGLTEEEYAAKVRAQVIGASVLALHARGYSLEQITLGLLSGTVAGGMPPAFCTVILDEAPARSGQDAMAAPDGDCLPLEQEGVVDASASASPSESQDTGGSGGGAAPAPDETDDAPGAGREVILRGPFPGADVTLANNPGDVVRSETVVVTVDGVVQSVVSVLEIENWNSSIEDGEVLCVSEGELRIATTGPATESAAVVDLPAIYTIESRNGTGPDCDLPTLQVEVTARVIAEDDTVYVDYRLEGTSVGRVEVTR